MATNNSNSEDGAAAAATRMVDALFSVPDAERKDPDASWNRIKDTQIFIEPPSIVASERRAGVTRLVLMSDTHGVHRNVVLPQGDVLVHGGDLTRKGEMSTVVDLAEWFGSVASKFSEIVCIAGNHDLPFHSLHYEKHWQGFHEIKSDPEKIRASLRNCTYLEDSSCVVAGGLKIFGSPWTPLYFNWAFNLPRGDEILGKWRQIPDDTDILITHGPPLGRGDLVMHGPEITTRAGCFDLLREIQTRVKPRVHIFGHIHEGHGVTFDGQTIYANACNVNLHYRATHPCVVIDVPHNQNQGAVVVQPNCRVRGNELQEWFQNRSFSRLADFMENMEQSQLLPSGNDLLNHDCFVQLCDAMRLHRHRAAQQELRKALAQMHAESFDS